MSNAEEPKAGQWWLSDEGKPMLIAFDERTIGSVSGCPIIAYRKPDCGEWYAVKRFVRRLPDDAGFDWKPEPEIVFPQYWTCLRNTPAEYAFVKRTSEKQGVVIKTDGTQSGGVFCWSAQCQDQRTQLTKDEAEARIVKPEPKYPQYWTTLDTSKDPESIAYIIRTGPAAFGDHIFVEHSGRHHDMFGCAWNTGGRRRLTKEEAESLVIKPKSIPEIVFDPKTFTSDWGPFPEQPPKPNRIPVRLYWYDGNVVARYGHTSPTDPSFVEIKLDPQMIISGSGFYVEQEDK